MPERNLQFRPTLAAPQTATEPEPRRTITRVRMGAAGVGLLVDDYHEASRILSDVDVYGSAGELTDSVFDDEPSNSCVGGEDAVYSVNQTDGEHHRRVRQALRRVIDKRVRAIARDLIDDVDTTVDRALGLGTFDAVDEIGTPIANAVMSRLLGLDDRLVESLRAAVYGGHPVSQLDGTLVDWVAQRRAQPTDDLVSDLMAELPSLDDRMVAANTRLLALSGVEVLGALVTNAIVCLAQDPATQDAVRRDEALLPDLIREVQRFASPIARGVYRMTKQTSTIGPYTVPAGTLLAIGVDRCNRDAAALAAGHEFDVEAHRGFEQLTFGRGRHSCLGIPVTRLVVTQAIRTFVQRTAGVSLTIDPSELRFHDTIVMNGLVGLPIRVELSHHRGLDQPGHHHDEQSKERQSGEGAR
ncbi:cytochrome P450 [Nocardioides aurantiacus]|uniref:Cytochrome P450 n=1 Tax=Nocardioides aurantiacus TaxID=86796 RepID=A0A3N2CUC4_9ACTN|nr:cytochrome P450 [Nocardioides aurantiacus]